MIELSFTRIAQIRYYLSMLSVVAVDFLFALIYDVPLSWFAVASVPMIVAILVGAHVIFLPIGHYLSNPESEFPEARTLGLATTSTLFLAFLLLFMVLFKFWVVPSILGIEVLGEFSLTELIWLPVIHCLFYTSIAFFALTDYEYYLRKALFKRFDRPVASGSSRILYRLLAAFGLTSVLPISLIALHVLERPPEELPIALIQDVQAALIGLVIAVFFITRSLVQPIVSLERSVQRIRTSDTAGPTPVLSNDETGRLAEGFNQMVQGLQERAFIRETFGKYVPDKVAASVLAQGGLLSPSITLATILYTDIEGFYERAAALPARKVVEMLNAYFEAVSQQIEKEGGVVNQFQGDALLVTFNVPAPDPDHADAAVRAAIGILDTTDRMSFAGVHITTRIGISTGEVIAGNVGAKRRLTYTVHGEAVNLASRLENLNKNLGTRLLIDQATYQRLNHEYPLESLGESEIRGSREQVALYGQYRRATSM